MYFVNATNNLDSAYSTFGRYSYHYDGKVNQLKDHNARMLPYGTDENPDYVDDLFWGNTVAVYTYTYNANNLPLICSVGNQITYYFYE